MQLLFTILTVSFVSILYGQILENCIDPCERKPYCFAGETSADTESKCTGYFQCSNGVWIPRQLGLGTYYDPVSCQQSVQSSVCKTCPAPEPPGPCPGIHCIDGVKYPDKGDCTKYYDCASGILSPVKTCAFGFDLCFTAGQPCAFDPVIRYCITVDRNFTCTVICPNVTIYSTTEIILPITRNSTSASTTAVPITTTEGQITTVPVTMTAGQTATVPMTTTTDTTTVTTVSVTTADQTNAAPMTTAGPTASSLVSVQIDKYIPNYGPVAGETPVTLTGRFTAISTIIDLYLQVKLDALLNATSEYQFTTQVTNWTSSVIQFQTPIVNESFVDESFTIFIKYTATNGDIVTSDTQLKYTYKQNPTVATLFPKSTIFRGGITFTAVGTNFDSVAFPLMVLIVETREKTGGNSSFNVANIVKYPFDNTTVQNNTIITGNTPALNINGTIATKDFLQGINNVTTSRPASNSEVKIFVGIELNGQRQYENLSRALGPEEGTITLYQNPRVQGFRGVLVYNPSKQTSVDIPGGGFVCDLGYTVTVGSESGKVVEVLDNVIVFQPPQEEPQPALGPFYKTGMIHVKLLVGVNVQYAVGHLEYTQTSDVILYATVVPILLIFAAVVGTVVFFCICRKNPKKDKDKRKRKKDIGDRYDNMEIT